MMICRRADVLPVECVVRGYLSGSGWKDYRATGAVCGIPLPAGLRESDRLPEPIFTPVDQGGAGPRREHRLRRDGRARRRPARRARRDIALRALRLGAAHAASRAGILLADTKFEFGLDPADAAS